MNLPMLEVSRMKRHRYKILIEGIGKLLDCSAILSFSRRSVMRMMSAARCVVYDGKHQMDNLRLKLLISSRLVTVAQTR